MLRKTKDEIVQENARLTEMFETQRRRVTYLENEKKALSDAISSLKVKLFDANMRVQFLEGYMDRVSEDDAAREDTVEVEQPNPQGGPNLTQRISKRHLPTYQRQVDLDHIHYSLDGLSLYGGERYKPDVHWVNLKN